MGKLPMDGGSRGAGRRQGSRAGSQLGSRVFSARGGGLGIGSPSTSLSTSDEKTRRISRQHTVSNKGSHPVVAVATPSLGDGREQFHAVKRLFKPYQVGVLHARAALTEDEYCYLYIVSDLRQWLRMKRVVYFRLSMFR